MTSPAQDPTRQLRWGVYILLIALSVGNISGRLLAVNSVDRTKLESYRTGKALQSKREKLIEQGLSGLELEQQLDKERQRVEKLLRLDRPFLSSNDRSRWLAIRALVEKGTFAIDELVQEPTWDTIDMVQHRGRDGQLHLYSSKPPLLMTLLAGEYWLIHQVTGMTLAEQPYVVGRAMLFSINVLPLVLMFWLFARLVDRFGKTDWGRIFVMASATLGTLLLPFAVVLNNHIIGAVSAAVTLFALVRSGDEDQPRYSTYALAGLAAAFTAANELPALALLALVAGLLWMRDRRMWQTAFLPAAGLVVIAFFATNYAAHNSLRPPYMHRSATNPDDNWYEYTYTKNGKPRESYWLHRQGIDRGEPSKADYALHVLIGHHGILSLTPVWLLSGWGTLIWLREKGVRHLLPERPEGCLAKKVPDTFFSIKQQLAFGITLLTIVCLVFFIGLRPQVDRNYGGMTSGFRWMFWFAPLWLLVMVPAADRLARSRLGQAFALVLLAMSALSASYPTWNPWTQPWIYRWLEYCGWQGF